MLGSRETAMDVAQDTFIKMMKRLKHQKTPIENTRAWLYKVAGNLCLNEISKNRMRQERQMLNEAEYMESSTPEATLIENEQRNRVRQAISELEPVQQMLVMMYNDGLSYREMAKATGIKEPSVGKTLWRIIYGLSAAIKETDNDE